VSEAQAIDQSFNCIRDALTLMRSGQFKKISPIRQRLVDLGYTEAEVEDAFKRIATEYEKQGDYAQ
jgi:Holliday junction resolvasome RuvABC DNA-binding subunit